MRMIRVANFTATGMPGHPCEVKKVVNSGVVVWCPTGLAEVGWMLNVVLCLLVKFGFAKLINNQ